MTVKTPLTELLHIDFPLIIAPMFLVSNKPMMEAGIANGVAAAFPSLNYRKDGELEKLLNDLNQFREKYPNGTYGVNLIVQKTNPLYEKHLEVCVSKKVPFYITSLGNPKTVIEKAHSYGGKVFCDVTNIVHAQKCADLGCDGFIAVGNEAGGHAGPKSLNVLVPELKKHFPDMPIIAAGGIANGKGIHDVIGIGACGVSIGTRFIATTEAAVSEEYKNAIVKAKAKDIVFTERLSGTPCAIIRTPYSDKIGYKQSWLEKLLSKNKRTKKWFKMLVQYRGMKQLEKGVSATGNYANLWSAGRSVEFIDDIKSCEEIIGRMKEEYRISDSTK
jgi:nitronate monooxygenase